MRSLLAPRGYNKDGAAGAFQADDNYNDTSLRRGNKMRPFGKSLHTFSSV